MSIKTEAENNRATGILKAIKTMRVAIEDRFNPSVRQAKAAYDSAKELRDSFLDPLKECEASLRIKIGEFVTIEKSRRDALQAEADAKFAKAKEDSEITGVPLAVAPVVVQQIKGSGKTSFTTTWYAEVVSIKDICKGIIDGTIPECAIEANMPYFNKLATATKQEVMIAPGVMAKKKTITRV